jgi:hypothetical protein
MMADLAFKVENNKVEFINRLSLFVINYGMLHASINLPIPNNQRNLYSELNEQDIYHRTLVLNIIIF